jgi:hypothetical protein
MTREIYCKILNLIVDVFQEDSRDIVMGTEAAFKATASTTADSLRIKNKIE